MPDNKERWLQEQNLSERVHGGNGARMHRRVCEAAKAYIEELEGKLRISTSTGEAAIQSVLAVKKPNPPSLRDLADKVADLAREHPCFSQVTKEVDVFCGHLYAMARIQEINQDDARPLNWIEFDYVNYRGERSHRRVHPISPARWGTSEWYPEKQWLMMCFDEDKNDMREFALDRMSNVKQMDR